MADPAVHPDPDAGSDTEPDGRGRLVVKDRAVSKIAAAAALSVPGVVRHTGSRLKLPGRDLPRAEITAGADAVAVTLYLAVAWPSPVAPLARNVHDTVTERVETLTGLTLDHLHIVVAAAVPAACDEIGTEPSPPAAPAEGATAREPLARPDAAIVAVLVAVLLLGAAVVAGREFLIEHEVIAPAAWLRNSVDWIANLHWQNWMVPAALAAALTGLVLILVAVTPRTRTHLPVGSGDGPAAVWMRPTDVARMCSARAGTVGGVEAVHTTVDRRRITVHVTPGEDVDTVDLAGQVRATLEPALAVLTVPRELRVRVR